MLGYQRTPAIPLDLWFCFLDFSCHNQKKKKKERKKKKILAKNKVKELLGASRCFMVSGLPLTALIHLQVIFVGGIYKTGVQFQSATWEYTVLSEFKGLDSLPSSLQRCGRSSVTVLWALLPPRLSL